MIVAAGAFACQVREAKQNKSQKSKISLDKLLDAPYNR
jgi:hypothetical protein